MKMAAEIKKKEKDGKGRRRRRQSTMVKNIQESRHKYWATRLSFHQFAYTARSFTCSALIPLLGRPAALTRLLAQSLTPQLVGK